MNQTTDCVRIALDKFHCCLLTMLKCCPEQRVLQDVALKPQQVGGGGGGVEAGEGGLGGPEWPGVSGRLQPPCEGFP